MYNNNAIKLYYLQQMGITLWATRPLTDLQPKGQHTLDLNELKKVVATCQKCPLHATRTQTVFARGHEKASLMIIGEAPGFYEDKLGLPFVGKAGQLLDQMLQSIGLGANDVYIANVIKCRPPENRDPVSSEIEACCDFLTLQIKAVKPKLILGLGRFAGQFLLKKSFSITKMRKQVHLFLNTPVIISYHPAYLLRNPADKKKAYQDLVSVLNHL